MTEDEQTAAIIAPAEAADEPANLMAEIVASGVRVEISFDPRKEKYVVEFRRPDAEPDRAPFRVIGFSTRPGGYEATIDLAARCFLSGRTLGSRPVPSLIHIV